MNYLITTAIFLAVSAHATGDLTAPQKTAMDEVCEMQLDFRDTVRKMNEQRAIEAASGVKDLEYSRELGARFVNQLRAIGEERQHPNPVLKGVFIDARTNCGDWSDADDKMVTKEVRAFAKRIGMRIDAPKKAGK